MDIFLCKCIKEYKCFKLVDEKGEKDGPFTFKKENIYNGTLILNVFWGNCYVVVESDTGFSMGFNQSEFELYFKIIE